MVVSGCIYLMFTNFSSSLSFFCALTLQGLVVNPLALFQRLSPRSGPQADQSYENELHRWRYRSVYTLFKPFLIFLMMSCLPLSVLAQTPTDPVGDVRLVIGQVNLQSSVSGSKILEVGDEVYQGDQITTPTTGYAVVTLIDETKFTIKPDSVFKFESVDGSANGKVLTELLKGGLKAITGTIGSQNPPGFKIDTPLGSIGIRGTTLDARICRGETCNMLYEVLGCSDEPPNQTSGLLYVTVTQGIAYLDDCENDPDIKPGQVGVTDGTVSGCKVLNDVPCFLEEFVWQEEQQKDETLKSLEVPVLQHSSENNFLCQGDPICIQCQGDPNCIACAGDPDCYQCQGDPICIQCQGDPLCIQCQGDPICIQCQGDEQCIRCQGDPICIQCQGDEQCIRCQGDPLCIQCQGDFDCIRCNGIPACIDPQDIPERPTDPCELNPEMPECEMDPCMLDPTSTGCPMDPCVLNPGSTGCPSDPCVLDPTSTGCPMDPCILDPTNPGCPMDPCILDPSSPGCPMDPCILDPTGMDCVCMMNPNDPICVTPMCTTAGCRAECGPTPDISCICVFEPNQPFCL